MFSATRRRGVLSTSAWTTPAWIPGLLVMAVISALALGVAAVEERMLGQAVIEALVVALLSGVVLRNLLPATSVVALKAGANVSAKHILEVAVCLLGVSVYFPDILRGGPGLLGLVLGGVVMSLMIS